MLLYKDENLFLETHDSELPWVKIFTVEPYKELSEVPKTVRSLLFELLDFTEKEMLASFNPIKINIASFGNYLPHVHLHVTARFQNDSHFPEPMWGARQREQGYAPPPETLEQFYTTLKTKLTQGQHRE